MSIVAPLDLSTRKRSEVTKCIGMQVSQLFCSRIVGGSKVKGPAHFFVLCHHNLTVS